MHKTKLLLLSLLFLLSSINTAFAQEAFVVDDLDENGYNFTLDDVIEGDTTATGERNHTTYILKRGGKYLIQGKISSNYPLTLLGEEGPANIAPATIMLLSDESGSSPTNMFEPLDDFTAKNIYFLITDEQGSDGHQAIQGGADSIRITIDNCIFEFGDRGIRNNGKNCSFFMTNSIVRNLIEITTKDTPYHWFYHVRKTDADTVWFQNNTFLNIGSAPFGGDDVMSYFLFDHNTIVNAGLQTFHFYYWTNAVVTNNIFYNADAIGSPVDEAERAKQHGDSNVPFAVFAIDTLVGGPSADRIVDLKNNVYYVDPAIKAMWDSNEQVDPGNFVETVRAQRMFDDDATWPNLEFSNLFEEDPQFAVTPDILDNFIVWCTKMDQKPFETDAPEWIWSNPLIYEDAIVTWPLPEDLSYTNSTLMTASTDGFPVGDLNWFPNKKEEWLNGASGIGDVDELPIEFSLEQNYPNPFNPTTNINFSIPQAGLVSLIVYNIIGEEVSQVVNEYLNAGTHTFEFDASNLSSGIYFYSIKTNNFIQTKKMALLK